jgi:micrococcal nuclease
MSTTTRSYPVNAVAKVVDGDTVDLDVDLGFHVRAVLRFRLRSVNCPEIGAPGGAEARDFTSGWLAAGAPLMVTSWRSPGAYGRWEGVIIDARGESLNAALVRSGNATPA